MKEAPGRIKSEPTKATSDSLAGVVTDRVHQARVSVDPDVRLHAEVPLVALLGLVHLRVALAAAFLVELGAAMMVASTMRAALEHQALARPGAR